MARVGKESNMKKIYTKPMVAIENFTLTERIASCDAAQVVFDTGSGCGNNISTDWEIWVQIANQREGWFSAGPVCKVIPDIGSSFGEDDLKLCYHTSNNSVFGS